jgi:septation ring formation regulator EzrA
MKLFELNESAEKLESLLEHYAKRDISVKDCLKILKPYIKKAKEMKISRPLEDIPCGYTFTEGELRQYPELEEAYADFVVLAEDEDIDDMVQTMRRYYPDF